VPTEPLLSFTTKPPAQLKAEIAQATALVEAALLDPAARCELRHAIGSGYYLDEMVFLRDLLDPEAHLPAHGAFAAQNPCPGAFKKAYERHWPAQSAQPSWLDENITLYFPYSENFVGQDLASWAVVGASSDTDQAQARQFGPAGYQTTVTVDDEYAAAQPLLVVGVNETAQAARTIYDLSAGPAPATRAANLRPENDGPDLYSGYGRLTRQMDHLISFTGNGGGSEMKVGCFSGYLQPEGSTLTQFASEVPTFGFSRKDIRRGHFVHLDAPWHLDWQPGELELAYVVWEEDNRGEQLATPGVATTVTGSNGAVRQGRISGRIPLVAQEGVLRQAIMSRVASLATMDIPLPGCEDDTRNLDDRTFRPAGQPWPVNDCGAIWSWTMPMRNF
jgi:hypothetical protein